MAASVLARWHQELDEGDDLEFDVEEYFRGLEVVRPPAKKPAHEGAE